MVCRGMGQKNAEFVARAGQSLGETLPTGFCLKTVVLVQLRGRPVNTWQGYCKAVSSAGAPTLNVSFPQAAWLLRLHLANAVSDNNSLQLCSAFKTKIS